MLINNQGEDMVKNNPLSADVLTSIFRTSPKDEHRIITEKALQLNLKNLIVILQWLSILKLLRHLLTTSVDI